MKFHSKIKVSLFSNTRFLQDLNIYILKLGWCYTIESGAAVFLSIFEYFRRKTSWSQDGSKYIKSILKSPGKLAFMVYASCSITFSGAFLASGNSLSSSLTQRCMNCWTIGFSLLTIWKPVMLAPPCMTLSSKMSVKPWKDSESDHDCERQTFLLTLSVGD